MALDTTIGAATADSYVTVAEMDSYLMAKSRLSRYVPDWMDLQDDEKEDRLRMGTQALDTLPFRGERACVEQALAFPRQYPQDLFYLKGSYDERGRFETFEDVTDAAAEFDVDPPIIPDVLKKAQFELTLQVIHQGIMQLGVLEAADRGLSSVSLGGQIGIKFQDKSTVEQALSVVLGGQPLTSLTIVHNYLSRLLTKTRGRVIGKDEEASSRRSSYMLQRLWGD